MYFCLAFVGGIFASSFIFMPQLFLLGFLIIGVFLISIFWRYKKLATGGFCLLFLVLGIWRYQMAESKIVYPQEGNVEFVGIVVKEPDVRPASIKLVIKSGENGSRPILVTAGRYPKYNYGDRLKIIGRLEMPPVFDDFNYRDYLKKDGITAVMSFPKIEFMSSGFGNPIMEIILSFKNKFRDTAGSFISPPQEGFLEALVFGQESNISREWKDKLNITGTRHIAAVSGMNITIISSIISSFAPFYISIVLLFLYILMIGAQASAVRAFIMAVIFILAKKLGRMSSGSRAVFFAATFMLVQNPFLLTKDVGFQLSFLAILGLIYLEPYFSNWLRLLPNPKVFPLRTTLSATLSAQVFTLPILAYNFGRISLLSPVVNILIVPFLAPITILIFIFAIFGIILQPLGFLLSWPVWLSLTYITKIVDWFSKMPLVSMAVGNLHWLWLIVFYFILFGFIWWYNKRVWQVQLKKPGW